MSYPNKPALADIYDAIRAQDADTEDTTDDEQRPKSEAAGDSDSGKLSGPAGPARWRTGTPADHFEAIRTGGNR